MPIDATERYKLILAEHHYTSDVRLKIFQGWCLMYAAAAAAFAWVHHESKPLDWLVTAAAVVMTALMWLADARNRTAMRACREVGLAIERDPASAIPEDQRFFPRLSAREFFKRIMTHSRVIDFFSSAMIILLIGATRYLWSKHGALPQ
jgi:hypothetical protein